jgi:choloylglycine hydrolase
MRKVLVLGAFYHPGYAEYDYKHQSSKKDISVSQLIAYLLSNCADIEEVRNELENNIHVISLIEPLFGSEVPAHYIASDKSGNSIIIEFLAKKTIITPNPIGVITNSPSFAWHMTNLRNYLQLHVEPAKSISIDGVELAPLSSGTGMLGLPGDFTSPSRFVRAIALSKAASKTDNGPDTVLQALHTLDNFNVPLSSAEGADISQDQSLKRATVWSSAGDLTNLKYYYHTATNRRTRMIDLKKIDFNSSELVILPIEKNKQDDIYEIEIHSAIQVIPF